MVQSLSSPDGEASGFSNGHGLGEPPAKKHKVNGGQETQSSGVSHVGAPSPRGPAEGKAIRLELLRIPGINDEGESETPAWLDIPILPQFAPDCHNLLTLWYFSVVKPPVNHVACARSSATRRGHAVVSVEQAGSSASMWATRPRRSRMLNTLRCPCNRVD